MPKECLAGYKTELSLTGHSEEFNHVHWTFFDCLQNRLSTVQNCWKWTRLHKVTKRWNIIPEHYQCTINDDWKLLLWLQSFYLRTSWGAKFLPSERITSLYCMNFKWFDKLICLLQPFFITFLLTSAFLALIICQFSSKWNDLTRRKIYNLEFSLLVKDHFLL